MRFVRAALRASIRPAVFIAEALAAGVAIFLSALVGTFGPEAMAWAAGIGGILTRVADAGVGFLGALAVFGDRRDRALTEAMRPLLQTFPPDDSADHRFPEIRITAFVPKKIDGVEKLAPRLRADTLNRRVKVIGKADTSETFVSRARFEQGKAFAGLTWVKK